MIIGLSLIFGIMAIFLLMGKGGFLIAGYNTASESEKARYDEKKLCRVMGVGMMLIAFGLLATAFFKMIGVVIMLITIALALVVMFVGSGHCYREEYQKEVAKTPWYKNSQVYFAIIGILISIGVGIMMFIGNINVKFLDQSVVFKATLSRTTEVLYQDIEKVSYVENLDIGKKKWGLIIWLLMQDVFKMISLVDIYYIVIQAAKIMLLWKQKMELLLLMIKQ